MPEEKQIRTRSTPANYPVAYLYYANGMHHHAGSCCDANALHYSEIVSTEKLAIQECSDNPSPAGGIEVQIPASFTFDTRFQDTRLESGLSIIPTTIILHESDVTSPSEPDGQGVRRTLIGGNYKFVSENAALAALINDIKDLRFSLYEIRYSMSRNACLTTASGRPFCLLKRIAQNYYSFSSNNSNDNGREAKILEATFSLEFRIARLKIQQLPEIGYEQYFELTWGG